jgi:oligopeptide/dipeptide ABC transporter ATP-binding protein
MTALLEVRNLTKDFPIGADFLGRPRAQLRAVDDVSFAVAPGETLGFVGESGCGKTTVGRLILRLLAPTSGAILFDGQDITNLTEPEMRPRRRDIQVVFQDPYSSLNPRMMVRDIVGEPLKNFGFTRSQIDHRVAELMRIVGLPPEYMSRYPHAFSGGQRQRIGIARALAVSPKLVVCDEAVSALDVSIQAQILNLLSDIQGQFGLTLLFISHNLGVVRHVSHRIAVMYLGRLVELASEDALFERPLHPYTAALIAAVPEPDPATRGKLAVLPGEIPSPLDPPPGCPFNTRCPRAEARCRAELPEFREIEAGRWVRCHFPG